MNFSSKKKILALAIANGLLVTAAQNVSAVVSFDSTTPTPVKFASEIVIDDTSPGANGLTFDADNANISATGTVGFGLATDTTYYSRIELDNTAEFANVNGAKLLINAAGGSTVTGVFQSAVTIADTANAGVTHSVPVGANAVATANQIVFNEFTGVKPKNKSDINLTYSLYESAATSVSGGATGLLVSKKAKQITFSSAIDFATVANSAPLKIDVSLDSKKFEGGKTTVHLGDMTIQGKADISLANGSNAVNLANVVGTTSKLTISGDFAAADGDKTKVFLADNAGCAANPVSANSVTATEAVFDIGSGMLVDKAVCFTASTSTAMTGGTYSVTYSPATLTASDSSAKYAASAQAGDLATVKKNGTTLQTMFFTNTDGYVPRFYLTNTGGTEAPYSISVQTDEKSNGGLVALAAATSGIIPANSGILLKASEIIESGQRGTVIFSVSAPPASINGLFQVRNTSSGDFDSYEMNKQ